jgi:hypothetical protein
MKSTLEKMMASFVDDFYLEDDSAALAYMQELEYRQWYEEIGWREDINAELREIAETENEKVVREYSLTYNDFDAIPAV